jgi:hypothetical protein
VRGVLGGPNGTHACQVARSAGPGRVGMVRGRGDSARTARLGHRQCPRACGVRVCGLAGARPWARPTKTDAWSSS